MRARTAQARGREAAQVVTNPEFQRAFDSARENVISEMEKLELTGDNHAHAAQLINKLQATTEFKRELVRLISAGERAIRSAERDDVPASL